MSLAVIETEAPRLSTVQVQAASFPTVLARIVATFLTSWSNIAYPQRQEAWYMFVVGEGDCALHIQVGVCPTTTANYQATIRLFAEGQDGQNQLESDWHRQLVRTLDTWFCSGNQNNKWYNVNNELCYGVTSAE